MEDRSHYRPILPALNPESASSMLTFSQNCPLTKERHTFTLTYDDVLSTKRLEMIAAQIRYSTAGETGICASRSRALMQMIYKVIEWEKGLTANHPLLVHAGPYQDMAKGKGSTAGS